MPDAAPPPAPLAGRVDAVLFDLDDTLFDQMLYLRGAFAAAARAAAPDDPDARRRLADAMTDVVRARGTGGGRIFEEALARVTLDADALRVQRMADAFRAHAPAHIEPAPGVATMLATLAARWPLALVTDGEVPVQRAKLRALDLERHFAAVVFSDAIGGPATRKPSPSPYEAALAALGVRPGRALYVGDNPHRDFAGARALGILTVRVLTGEHAGAGAAAGDEPDFVVAAAADVLALLG